jgi:hypothetical protein
MHSVFGLGCSIASRWFSIRDGSARGAASVSLGIRILACSSFRGGGGASPRSFVGEYRRLAGYDGVYPRTYVAVCGCAACVVLTSLSGIYPSKCSGADPSLPAIGLPVETGWDFRFHQVMMVFWRVDHVKFEALRGWFDLSSVETQAGAKQSEDSTAVPAADRESAWSAQLVEKEASVASRLLSCSGVRPARESCCGMLARRGSSIAEHQRCHGCLALWHQTRPFCADDGGGRRNQITKCIAMLIFYP